MFVIRRLFSRLFIIYKFETNLLPTLNFCIPFYHTEMKLIILLKIEFSDNRTN